MNLISDVDIKSIKTIQKFLYLMLVSALIIAIPLVAIAEDSIDEGPDQEAIDEIIDEAERNSEESTTSRSEKKNEIFLMQLRRHIEQARSDYFQVHKTIVDVKDRLIDVTETISTLKFQLESLDKLIVVSETKIKNVKRQIAERQNKISLLETSITKTRKKIDEKKVLLSDYLKLLYIQENNFYDQNDTENKNISVSKLLLQDSSTGEIFQEIEYFNVLEQTGEQILEDIKNSKRLLANDKAEVTLNRDKLVKLNDQLEKEENQLKIQREAKAKLLEQTEGEEEIYRELLAQSKFEQLNILNEINTLKKNLSVLEKLIAKEGDNFDPEKYSHLINPNVRAIYEFEISGDFTSTEKLNWPVNPSKGLSAYFHDSGYKKTFGIPHNAIDIPIAQGSLIKAPAAGVVYRVQDNGMGYSYIIIAHKGGLMTVYGHISGFLVEESEVVMPGEVIGLTGGIPGTKGAGYLTTGAHLHFEVIKNGKHIDPLTMLPLDKLPIFGTDDEEEEGENKEPGVMETDK